MIEESQYDEIDNLCARPGGLDREVCRRLIPSWFKVPMPLGPYNLDWALLLEALYVVVRFVSDVLTTAREGSCPIP